MDDVDRAQRALAGGIEQPQRIDPIAVELDAHRVRVQRGADVDDVAADREGAGVLDQRRAGEPGRDQPRRGGVAIDDRAGAERQRALTQLGRRHGPAQQRGRRRHDESRRERAADRQAVQHRQPGRELCAIGGQLGVRRGVRGRQRDRLGAHRGQVRLERARHAVVGRDHDHRPARTPGQLGRRVEPRGQERHVGQGGPVDQHRTARGGPRQLARRRQGGQPTRRIAARPAPARPTGRSLAVALTARWRLNSR